MPLLRKYKHFNRYHTIAVILVRHGFGYLIDQLGLNHFLAFHERHQEQKGSKLSLGERIRSMLEELGPTFIKLGQLLSTRQDLLPPDIIVELKKLQDEVPPFEFTKVREVVEEQMGQSLDKLFAEFEENPLAAASIGQVHRARLIDTKQEVAVKIQRPGIEKMVRNDLEIMFDIARLAENHTTWGKTYPFVDMVAIFSQAIKEEIDYTIEGRNTEKFFRNFSKDDSIRIPKVFWDYSGMRVLTLEYFANIGLNEKQKIVEQGYNAHGLAQIIVHAMMKQILIDGIFHADPHPGNLLVLGGAEIGFIDFGMVGLISKERQQQFFQLMMGFLRGNTESIVDTILAMGVMGDKGNIINLRRDVQRLSDKYAQISLGQISLADSIQEIMNLAFKYHIKMPAEFTLLSRSLVTLEGTVQSLDPDLNILEVVKTFQGHFWKEKFSLNELKHFMIDNFLAYQHMFKSLPSQLTSIFERIKNDEVKIKMEYQETNEVFKHFDKIANKISFSIVLLSFSIIMAGLIIGSNLVRTNMTYNYWNLPILEIGAATAIVMAGWLFWSIFRSGRF